MAKSRASNSDGNEFTFEQLELALESAIGIGLENDERIQRFNNESNDSQLMPLSNRRFYSNRASNQNALQRNRNHYSCGHYCNIHQTLHQHYSHHSNHSSHHNHNHIHHNPHSNHNNRINSHSAHCNQQEIGLNEEFESHSTHGSQQQVHYTLDQSEFERVWRQLDNNKDRYNFLRSLYRSSPSGNLVFSEISFGSLGDIASALCEFDDTVEDFCFVVYILNSLSRTKRFLLSLQFLTCEERQECKKLFHKLWKSMNDKQQDLAENDISELTINDLMKSYEVDFD